MDASMRGRTFHILGYVHYHLGDYPRALEYHTQAYECSRETSARNRMAWNLMDVGFLHLKLGRFSKAKECLTESLALARRIAARPAEAYALTLLGDWDLYSGSYAAAVERFGVSLRLQAEVGSKHGIVAAEDAAGCALYNLGDLHRARERLQRALERARAIGHRRHVALSLIRLSLVELAAGSPGSARRLLSDALVVARESECTENVAAALAALARTKGVAGDLPGALECAREAAGIAHTRGLPTCGVWVEVEVGLGLLAQGEPQEAMHHTARAVKGLPRTHQAWIGTEEVHRAHARVRQALGHVDEAGQEVQLADAAVQAKADRMPDPHMRQRYLRYARGQASNLRI